VSQLINAFREDDQVIIVLPFHRSDDFRVSIWQPLAGHSPLMA
jgi:hypothetical protein